MEKKYVMPVRYNPLSKEERFEEFLDWQSQHVYNEMFGVNDE